MVDMFFAVDDRKKTVQPLKKRNATLGKKKVFHGIIGYSAPYAVYVHEDLPAYHSPHQHGGGTKAKFLEDPVRRYKDSMRVSILVGILRGDSVHKSMMRAAKIMFGYSWAECPEDTGALRASGYVREDKERASMGGGGSEGGD